MGGDGSRPSGVRSQADDGLIGRRAECEVLDQLLATVRAGTSQVLIIHGQPGVGKSALLDYVARRSGDCRLIRAAGVESEMELAYSALHQLCAPMLDRLDDLPSPQRDALSTALGLRAGPAPDRLLIGLAVLSLLSDAAETRPLMCLVDDLQWLDSASAQTLAFVARRLAADPVGLVAATRVPDPDIGRLPTLKVRNLARVDARTLLDTVLTAPIDERVRARAVAETRGNPLALMELPRSVDGQDLAGGFALPGAARISEAMEDSYRREVEAFPAQTRQLLLLAAAEPLGDAGLLWRAAEILGIGADAAIPAVDAGLIEFGTQVRFRHPLIRSVAYRSARLPDKQEVHKALAAVTDSERDPDRRAWHRAYAAPGPDDEVAAELERAAERARSRGGVVAAAAFLERATTLTLDPAQRARRALGAASAKVEAGAFDAATELLATAERGPLDELQRARADLVRAQLAFATSRGGDAPLLLLTAARKFEPVDPGLARAAYLDAISAAAFAGRLASPGGDVVEVARAATTSRSPEHSPGSADLLLDGLAANFVDGYPAAVPYLRDAIEIFGDGMSGAEELRWMWLINEAALHLWDDRRWATLSERFLFLARSAGAMNQLPLALSTRAMLLLFTGDLAGAGTSIDEQRILTEATGSSLAPYTAMTHAALRGWRAETLMLVDKTAVEASRRGEGISIAVAEWTAALLHNGFGDYPEAMAAAERALDHQEYPDRHYPGVANWAAAELIEAATRAGRTDKATEAMQWIARMTAASGTDWALGVQMRSRALLADDDAADALYLESVNHLRRSRVRTELGRSHLLYGEWLRRQRRRTDARTHLRIAYDLFDTIGMHAFADRARRELQATGVTARKHATAAGGQQLTPQEAQVARLASEGLSNREIGARLFISARTVQYHLRKVFTKLGITSRNQLHRTLPAALAAGGVSSASSPS